MNPLHLRWRLLVLLFGVVLVGLIGGIMFASDQEQDDRFCISCHTQPESDFFARAQRADQNQNADDLASFHHRKQQVRCIDCHVGEGVAGRAMVLTLAAWDTVKHYTGIARQPAVIVFPVQNEACVKCHALDIRKPGFENHEHNQYFNPQLTPPFIACTDCHLAHRTGDERTAFQFRDAILPKCEYCHTTVGKGPKGLSK